MEGEEEGSEAEPWGGGVKYDAVMTKDGFIYPSKEDSETCEKCDWGGWSV